MSFQPSTDLLARARTGDPPTADPRAFVRRTGSGDAGGKVIRPRPAYRTMISADSPVGVCFVGRLLAGTLFGTMFGFVASVLCHASRCVPWYFATVRGPPPPCRVARRTRHAAPVCSPTTCVGVRCDQVTGVGLGVYAAVNAGNDGAGRGARGRVLVSTRCVV